MHIKRIADALPYEAPNHIDMECLRLQGKEAGPSAQMWMALNRLEPGGQTGLDPSPIEKLYFVVEGEVTMVGQIGEQTQRETLRLHDSARFAPGESRQLVNETDRAAKVLLVMANVPAP